MNQEPRTRNDILPCQIPHVHLLGKFTGSHDGRGVEAVVNTLDSM